MKSIQYKINDPLGIHARPAGLLVKAAAKYTCDTKIKTVAKEVDAKRIMGVMSLGVKGGDLITMTFDGPDETQAAEDLAKFLKETL